MSGRRAREVRRLDAHSMWPLRRVRQDARQFKRRFRRYLLQKHPTLYRRFPGHMKALLSVAVARYSGTVTDVIYGSSSGTDMPIGILHCEESTT